MSMVATVADLAVERAPSTQPLTHPKYRRDIDGLRAVAVLSVLGYHAFPEAVHGGFVGVDIFFVISGFLISTIIFSSLDARSFSFAQFYSRRIKRIFPALVVVLAACFAFGWFSLLAAEYEEFGKHVAAGAGFVSNLVLWKESGYFDTAGEGKLLLHLWSLGIEEQFYIVWPLLLWVLWRKRFNLLTAALLIAVASFALNIRTTQHDAVAAFYAPQMRFWELLTGALLAWLALYARGGEPVFGRTLGRALSKMVYSQPVEDEVAVLRDLGAFAGAALIAAAIVLMTPKTPFPGWWAALPVVGSALLISAGPHTWFNRVVLSLRPMVWVGLISYPLYLWHWPVLTFARIIRNGTPSVEIRSAAVVLTILLSWMTYLIVERPVRSSRAVATPIILAALMAIVGGAGLVTYAKGGLPFRYTRSINERSVRGFEVRLKGDGVVDCGDMLQATSSAFCARTAAQRVAIIGDSHSGSLFHGFVASNDSYYKQAIVMGAGSCQAALDTEGREGCNAELRTALDYIEKNRTLTTVVLAGYYGIYDHNYPERTARYVAGYTKTMRELYAHGKWVVFIVDNPALKVSAERCEPGPLTLRQRYGNHPAFCDGATPESVDWQDQGDYRAFVEMLKRENPQAMFFDPRPLFCDSGKCTAFKDGKLLYEDTDHLSIYGSSLVADWLIPQLPRER